MSSALRSINLCPICTLAGDLVDAARRAGVLDGADEVARLVDQATHTQGAPAACAGAQGIGSREAPA